MPDDTSQLDPSVVALMAGLKSNEGAKGNYNAQGDKGTAAGIGMWSNEPDGVHPQPLAQGQIPANFANTARQYGLDPTDFTPANQNKVMYATLAADKKAGLSPEQSLSKWNSGDPNKYQTETSTIGGPVGSYNVANYVKNGMAVAQKYAQSHQSSGSGPNTAQASTGGQSSQVPDYASRIGNFLFPGVKDVYNDVTGQNTGANAKTGLQQAGDIALTALPFVPGLGELGEAVRGGAAVAEGGVDAAKGAGLLGTVAKNAGIGYGAGVASNLSQGQSVGQSIMPNLNTIGGALVGGGTAGLLKGLTKGAPGLLNSATEDVTKVLSPTTKTNKAITQQIAPRLAQSGIVSASREGLLSKYEANLGQATDALNAGYDALPANAKFEVSNLFDGLQQKIDALTVNGTVPSAAQAKVAAYQGMMKDLANIGLETSPDGSKVFADVANVRKLRQIVDEGTTNFSFTDLDKASAAAKKQLGNSIRAEFAKQYPDIAKLNSDFSFWSKASSVLSDAIERKTGQTGIIRKGIGAGLGMAAGASTGHPIISAAIGKMLSDFVESPAFHTTSALVKSKLASLIEKGDAIGASRIIQLASKTAPILGATVTPGLLNTYVNPPQR